MQTTLKTLVRGYARFISPFKGYQCAHRLHHGGESCSEFYLNVLETHPTQQASTLLWRRLKSCGHVARTARRDNSNLKGRKRKDGKLIIPCVPFI